MTAKQEKDEQVQTAIRLPQSLVDRLDKLAAGMSRPGIPVTRSEVLRLALHCGVEQLEGERKKR